MTPQIDCVIFDNDGTLVDSEKLDHLALSTVLARDYGVRETPEQLTAEFSGWKLDLILETLQQRHAVRLRDRFVEDYRRLQHDILRERLEPIPGVEQALREIALPKCVASSGPPDKIELALRLTGLIGFFDGRLFSAYTVGIWKPDPGLFLHAAAQMGVPPARCAVVEDSRVGVEAGLAAGMQVYWFNPQGRPNPDRSVCSFASMTQLPALLCSCPSRKAAGRTG